MAKVNDKYPDDLDVMALYAESLMVLKPWALWAKKAETSDEIVPADGNTVVAKKVLERVSEPKSSRFRVFYSSEIRPSCTYCTFSWF